MNAEDKKMPMARPAFEPQVRCYRVTFDPVPDGGMQTCKPRTCVCCHRYISGHARGGEHFCDYCYELMRKRVFAKLIRCAGEYDEDPEKGLLFMMDALRAYDDEHVRT